MCCHRRWCTKHAGEHGIGDVAPVEAEKCSSGGRKVIVEGGGGRVRAQSVKRVQSVKRGQGLKCARKKSASSEHKSITSVSSPQKRRWKEVEAAPWAHGHV
eukprot:TRINITY_DN12059_c0_g1_i1.p1 TRINITY_DN12059_c0_g1~~TRINITY_DN12059_c0_g1_i1.p1  ORF type:complete len:101 (-),score=10.03 TRINITY_DN12059_c0_g1_i1:411-713(-)